MKKLTIVLLITVSMMIMTGFNFWDWFGKKNNADSENDHKYEYGEVANEDYLMQIKKIKEVVKNENGFLSEEYPSYSEDAFVYYYLGKKEGNTIKKVEHYAISYDGTVYSIADDDYIPIYGIKYEEELTARNAIQSIDIIKECLNETGATLRHVSDDIFTTIHMDGANFDIPGQEYELQIPGKVPRYFWYVDYQVADKYMNGVWEEFSFNSYDKDYFSYEAYYYSSWGMSTDYKQALLLGNKQVDIDKYIEERAECDNTFLSLTVIRNDGFEGEGTISRDTPIKIDGYLYNVYTCGIENSSEVTITGVYASNIVLRKVYLLDSDGKKVQKLVYDDSMGNNFSQSKGSTSYEVVNNDAYELEDDTTEESEEDDFQENIIQEDDYSEEEKDLGTDQNCELKNGVYYPKDSRDSEPIEVAIWHQSPNPAGCIFTYDILMDHEGYHELNSISRDEYEINGNSNITLKFSKMSDSNERMPIYIGTDSNEAYDYSSEYYIVDLYEGNKNLGTYVQSCVILSE